MNAAGTDPANEKRASGTREWDAGTYDRVSAPQLGWGRTVLERLAPRRGETVLDAGCGSGRVTELIADALPEGRLIGVDGSKAMIDRARERLGARAELIWSDLLELDRERLSGPVDAVFSSATFHWIADHGALFRRISRLLTRGGRIEAQCGGAGNIDSFLAVSEAVAAREPFDRYLSEVGSSRHFADAVRTEARLKAAGFERVRCWLEPAPERPPEPRAYMESVCLGAHLEALPPDLRERFADEVYAEWGPDRVLDYVRLNISAALPE